ncbi:MAG: hypothetical protein JXA97_00385 [Anaerolineales bacterium]|nr:hypothetical protein [Anaerolineales bacterium]
MVTEKKKALQEKIHHLSILQDDASLRAELGERYGRESQRRWFTTACCEEAVEEALRVDRRANTRMSGDTLFLRYRSDRIDDGIAIWRTGEEDYGLYRWYRDLD